MAKKYNNFRVGGSPSNVNEDYAVWTNDLLERVIASKTVIQPGKSTQGHKLIDSDVVYVITNGRGSIEVVEYMNSDEGHVFLIPYLLILIILMYLNGPLILFVYMSVVGLTQAIGENVSGSLWAEMYGVNNLGSIKALMTFFGILASAASPFLFGIILDQGDTLNMLILGTIILIIIFSVLSYIGKYFK